MNRQFSLFAKFLALPLLLFTRLPAPTLAQASLNGPGATSTTARRLGFLGFRRTAFAEAGGTPLRITVFTYNYDRVPSETLARAIRSTAEIYGHAGIETKWLDCPVFPEETVQHPGCQLPLGPTWVALRLLSRDMADRLRLNPGALGAAFGTFSASVYAYRVAEIARQFKWLRRQNGLILGCLMAHEVGHLLLGVDAHSLTGIMHEHWGTDELKFACRGWLLFTPRQAAQIRTQVYLRMMAEGAVSSRARNRGEARASGIGWGDTR